MSEGYNLKHNRDGLCMIIEALQFYRDNAIQPKFKSIVDRQISHILKQLNEQNANIYVENQKARFNFGELVKFENEDALIVGMSNDNGFVTIATGDIKLIDVPIVLVDKINTK